MQPLDNQRYGKVAEQEERRQVRWPPDTLLRGWPWLSEEPSQRVDGLQGAFVGVCGGDGPKGPNHKVMKDAEEATSTPIDRAHV